MSGLLRCQYDSYLRSLKTTVSNCIPISKSMQQEFKNKVPKTAKYAVQLDDSVLFCEGGGQPSDLGTIGLIPVLYVGRNSEGNIYVIIIYNESISYSNFCLFLAFYIKYIR